MSGKVRTAGGTAGTRADPAALWSGTVSCFWQGNDTAIAEVGGFDVPITDAAFLAAGNLLDAHVEAVDGNVVGVDLDGEPGSGGSPHYTYFPVGLEDLSSDRRTGTAVLNTSSEIIFRWKCNGGP